MLQDSYWFLTTQCWLTTCQRKPVPSIEGWETLSHTHYLFPLSSEQSHYIISSLLAPAGEHHMTADPFRLFIVCPASYLSPCASSFFLPCTSARGRALQLIRDLPVEFHCDKGSYSCRQDGEKAASGSSDSIARREVSKMKRLDFEGFQRHPSSALDASPLQAGLPVTHCQHSS